MGGIVVLLSGVVGNWLENESLAERRFIARQMALSGVALGLNPAIKPGNPLLQSGSPDTEGYEVRIDNEAARINPNFWIEQGGRPVFLRLFESWGVDRDASEAAIDGLTDWIDGDDFLSRKGAERGEYERAGRPGYPANKPLRHIREMDAVMNLAPILTQKENWQDYFTVWYSGKISIQHAQEPILRELAELTPSQIEALVKMRAGRDGSELPMTTSAWQRIPELRLASMNLRELRDLARALRLWGYSSLNREQLTSSLLRKIQARRGKAL